MSAPPYENRYMTQEEYFDLCDESDIRYEYVNGEVLAMTGASVRHNTIIHNIDRSLGNQLGNKDCVINTNETRVQVDSKSSISYRFPDIIVVCGKVEFMENRNDTILNPTVLIEVLSPATALIDRNQKFDEHTQLLSLEEYVLVSQDEFKIERFLRQDADNWLYTRISGLDGIIKLPSIDCELDLSAVYAKLDLLDG